MRAARPWVVVRVRPQLAKMAVKNLARQGCEVYSPRCRESIRGRPREGALFPGYLFVRHPEGRWSFLSGTYGVTAAVMGTGGYPATIPDAEIARLRAREGPDGAVALSRSLETGDRVRVWVGTEGLDAVVAGMPGRERVMVLMQVLGAWRRAEVGLGDVELP